MMKSPITYFVGSVILAGGLGWLIKSDKLSLGPVDKIFKADELTPADYEEMHIERSGATLDYVPQSLSESFMGYQYLDLEHTSMVANDLPFGPGVIDHQYLYENAYDLGYDDSTLIADMNRETHPLQEYVPQEMAAEAPGQGALYGRLKETNSITPVTKQPVSVASATDPTFRDTVSCLPRSTVTSLTWFPTSTLPSSRSTDLRTATTVSVT